MVFFLGLAKDWCVGVLWALIENDIYDLGLSVSERMDGAVERLRSDLRSYFRSDRGRASTQLEDLTVAMLGSREKLNLNVKASECKGLMPFCLEMLRKHSVRLPPSILRLFCWDW